ncbi:2Fe-2S iron-sulfur cluster binding domain-containing protein [Gordonia sp. HNM0687]|uniref:2Fe-2S iron-sulfur cluster binding domain-containing protein n=1 Tax=Gordonia mangrovi TaxID=2665643 RepID=A0A6L7GWB0_9ACTN|nr:2Fe-2S iron-sulfur cluster-binding protein [Gordonia mangrovi]MXP23762.1 2Fe-2S iron-sulfur cluster binding domain-containing protein [Gordonia mangrovi]UVF79818.1 2Fe-2S iron-sulfur cluster-binding protein [Gordonia mangrovi]
MTAAHSVTVVGSDTRTVDCAPGQPLLDAFLRHGVYLPNSCNQGTCGTCKVRLCSGSVSAPEVSETVLGADDQANGYVLACQSTPTSDAQIEVPVDAGSGPRHPLRDLTGTVHEVSEIAHDTLAVTVGIDEPLEFSAGQYIEFVVPGSGTLRQYSMANPPSRPDRLEFHIRRVPDGLATDRWIFDSLAHGHPVEMRGPWGDFVHDTESDAPMILLAGGTGLAPLKSIALHALERDPDREIHLYHGVRHRSDLYDVEFWQSLADRHPGLRYTPCLSREEGFGRHGYVGDVLVDDFDSLRGFSAYLCGPPAMVDAGVKACKRRRMSGRNIHREKYTPAPAGAMVLT